MNVQAIAALVLLLRLALHLIVPILMMTVLAAVLPVVEMPAHSAVDLTSVTYVFPATPRALCLPELHHAHLATLELIVTLAMLLAPTAHGAMTHFLVSLTSRAMTPLAPNARSPLLALPLAWPPLCLPLLWLPQ